MNLSTNTTTATNDENTSSNSSASKYHTAGYDAYITGYVFIKQINQCIEYQNSITTTNNTNNHQVLLSLSIEDMIKNVNCCNKLFMMRSFYHLILDPTISSGTEFKYTTGLMIRITKFNPTSTNNTLIQQLFLAANYTSNEMYINWIDNESFFIHILTYNKDDLISINKYQSIAWPIEWKVETFSEYLQALEDSKLQVNQVTPEIALVSTEDNSKKRKITSDSNSCIIA